MATPADAELLLKLYELRQDERMRTARNWVLHEFAPQSLDELLVVQREFGSLHNQYWRQMISYWEMAAAFVLHGALDRDLFFDSVGENIYLLAKFGSSIRSMPRSIRAASCLTQQLPSKPTRRPGTDV